MTVAYVCGNGPSLTLRDCARLEGRVYGVNRIWKLWAEEPDRSHPDLLWRPTHYVRCELPEYDPLHVEEDVYHMADFNGVMYLQAGFRFVDTARARAAMGPHTKIEYFETCSGEEDHPWHLPRICGHGTVVHVAMQLAVLDGADEIRLLGCDLGLPNHFYGEEGAANDDLAIRAHVNAAMSCPVPVIDAGLGNLWMYGDEHG